MEATLYGAHKEVLAVYRRPGAGGVEAPAQLASYIDLTRTVWADKEVVSAIKIRSDLAGDSSWDCHHFPVHAYVKALRLRRTISSLLQSLAALARRVR